MGTALQRASVSLTFPLWDTFHVLRLMTLLDAGTLYKPSPQGKGRLAAELSEGKGLSEHIGKVLYRE